MSEKQAAQTPAADGATEGITLCPYCGDNVPSLASVETGMKLRLAQETKLGTIPDQVCDGCLKLLTKMISKGAVLRAEQQAKEQSRVLLWRNRVQLVKQAKAHLMAKRFAEAAISYEKYLRVLEIVYECKPGEMKPDLFTAQTRAQEMTVITSVYWDLMRIYDTSPSHRERQIKAGQKLAEFAHFTPIFPHIVRKAASLARSAKNPEAFDRFLKSSHANRPRCFIATAAYDGQRHATVSTLMRFRDEHMKRSSRGRRLIAVYYRRSPSIASFLDNHPALKPAVRKLLTTIATSEFVRKRLSR